MNRTFLFLLLLMIVSMVSVSCGSETPESEDSDPGGDSDADGGADGDTNADTDSDDPEDYYPMAVGAYWTYQETPTGGGDSVELTYEVTASERMDFGGATGTRDVFVVENTFDIMNEKRIQFIEDDGTRAVRHGHEVYVEEGTELVLTKDRYYEPGFLRFDRTRLTEGETWDETITRTTDTYDGMPIEVEDVTYRYTVISVGEPVPIGDLGVFNCIQLQRTGLLDQETKFYWFAPGVGKVQELTGDKIEVLSASSYLE